MEINNTKLVELIKKMKDEKTAEAQNEVITEILKSKFLCPVIIDKDLPKNGKVEIRKDTKIQFSILKTNEQKSYLLAFTSDSEVNKWQKVKTQQSIVYTFEDYAMIVTNNDKIDGFVIDPFGSNLIFNKDIISEIKSNLTHETSVKKDTQIEIAGFEYPEGLLEKLNDLFKNLKEINSAYLVKMKENDKVSYLITIDANGKEKEFFNTIVSALLPFVDGIPISLVAKNSEIGMQVESHFKPIYEK